MDGMDDRSNNTQLIQLVLNYKSQSRVYCELYELRSSQRINFFGVFTFNFSTDVK